MSVNKAGSIKKATVPSRVRVDEKKLEGLLKKCDRNGVQQLLTSSKSNYIGSNRNKVREDLRTPGRINASLHGKKAPNFSRDRAELAYRTFCSIPKDVAGKILAGVVKEIAPEECKKRNIGQG